MNITMNITKIVGAATVALLLAAGVAIAQTYDTGTSNTSNTGTNTGTTGTNTGATGTTGTGTGTSVGSSTSTLPESPNTGEGGNAATNAIALAASGALAAAGVAYLARRNRFV